MTDSKLINILSTLSKEEMKSFEKFIFSPFFSTGRNVSELFIVLKKYYPSFPSKKISKESIYEELYPGEVFNEKKLKNLAVGLTQTADEFLINKRLSKNYDKKEQMLAYEYKDRKLDKYYLSSIRIIENKINNLLFNSYDCFTNEEEFEMLKQEYYVENNDWDKAVESKLKYSEYFIVTFIVRYLRILREKVISERSYNIKYENEVLDVLGKSIDVEKFIKILLESNYKYSHLLAISYHSLKCAEDTSNEKSFRTLKELTLANLSKFSKTEKYILFSDMTAFCAEKEKFGSSDFLNEEFSLYKEMLNSDAYTWSEDDYMQVVTFRNIMIVGLTLKEYRWLEWFAGKYIDEIKPEYRENMKNLLLANISYAERKFDEALVYITKVKYDLFLYKLDVKILMLKIYFELNLYEQAYYLIDSFRHYLSNSDDLTESNKIQHTNFLNIYSKLLRAKSNEDTGEYKNILSELKNTELVSARNWLKEKINELIKKGAK